jgi:hypothetical protein
MRCSSLAIRYRYGHSGGSNQKLQRIPRAQLKPTKPTFEWISAKDRETGIALAACPGVHAISPVRPALSNITNFAFYLCIVVRLTGDIHLCEISMKPL